MAYRSGFVTLLGIPNAGKSTLLNALLQIKVSIVSKRPQTTRHRICGILTKDNFQIVFVDIPGVLQPHYDLHRCMQSQITEALRGCDAVLIVLDATQPADQIQTLQAIVPEKPPATVVAINKVDIAPAVAVEALAQQAGNAFADAPVCLVSALQSTNLNELVNLIVIRLPDHAPYFPPDELTDRTERFHVAELIREVIFEQFYQEIPHSAEVIVSSWQEDAALTRIEAEIWVERESQKMILLGQRGSAIKALGTEARRRIEQFLGRKIYLGLTVKVRADWRNSKHWLQKLGYHP